jgi:hypothetical protein
LVGHWTFKEVTDKFGLQNFSVGYSTVLEESPGKMEASAFGKKNVYFSV